MSLTSLLENEGFDRLTAETVVQTCDSKPVEEAKVLLESMLGENHPQVNGYIKKRQHAAQVSQLGRKTPSRIVVNEQKKPKSSAQKGGGTSSSTPKFSNEDKIDGVKELEAAIKQLSVSAAGRTQCDCMGSKHGLLEMAPNCLNCGRIVCNKEGLGPCMFCKAPLLPTDRIQQIQTILNTQRDEILGTMSKRALQQLGIDPKAVDNTARQSTQSSADAEANLERLLGYQDRDSERTRIIDRVGEVDLPTPSSEKWMTPDEQAEQIRANQRRLRQLEKERKAKMASSRKVISIDMKGRKTYQNQKFTVYQDEDVYVSDDSEDEEEENKGSGEGAGTPSDPSKEQEYGDDKPKSTTYYDPKKFEAPDIKAPHSAESQNKSFETGDEKPIEPELNSDISKSTVIRSADEDLLY